MPKDHVVRKGESAATVAAANGHLLDTVWEDYANDAIRGLREDPYMLCADDVLVVPDREPKEESAETGKRHSFRRLGVPDKLTVQLLDGDDAPYANRDYVIEIDEGRARPGKTSDEGVLEEWVSPRARGAKVVFQQLDGEPERLVWLFEFNTLAPAGTGDGFTDRLLNLGFEAEEGNETPVIKEFQRAHGLTADGEVDDAEIAALAKDYGC